jgi:hypothetical protein
MQNSLKSFFNRSWPYLLLVVLAVVFLGDVWFGGRMLLLRDFFFLAEPHLLYFGETLRSGSFPLWSSFEQCGIPYAASPYCGTFYLPNWIFIFPDTELMIRVWWTFHFGLVAASCYALARYWRMSMAPALFAAISFAFSTFIMAWLEFTLTMAWGILAMLLVSRIIDRTAEAVARHIDEKTALRLWPIFVSNAVSIVGLAASLTLLLLATGEFFYYCSLLLASYGLMRWLCHGSWKACGISLLFLGLAGILILALGAPQLISSFEMMRFSVRAGNVDPLLKMASEHPRHLLSLLLPYLYGRPGYPDTYWAPQIFEFANGSWYIGILPLIAVFFGWLRSKADALDSATRETRFLIWYLVAVLVGALLMSAGQFTPVYPFLHDWLPGMGRLRFATKFHFFSSFALAMLGGVGFQSLLACGGRGERKTRVRVWGIAAAVFSVFLLGYLGSLFSNDFLLWLMAHPKTPSAAQMDSAMLDYTWAALFTVLGLLLFGMLAFRRGPLKWVSGAIVAVAFLNLCLISRQAQPTGPAGIYTRPPRQLAEKIGGSPMYRYFLPQTNLQQYVYGEPRLEIWQWVMDIGATAHGQELGLASLTPVGLFLNRYLVLYEALHQASPPVREKVADLLSMRFFIRSEPFENVFWANASRDINIITRPTALPRAYLINEWQEVPDETQVLKAIGSDSFDPHQAAMVLSLPGETVPPSTLMLAFGKQGKVTSFADRGNTVSLEASTPCRSLLVLGDTFYPGWRVTVDGVPKPIFQTNFNFRGVFLEPGTHRVEFEFTPTHFGLGAVIWAAAVAICGGLLWLPRRFGELPVPQKNAQPARK